MNKMAARIVSETTSDGKNSAAVVLRRLGGVKGGKARARNLSATPLKAIAKKAAAPRWKAVIR